MKKYRFPKFSVEFIDPIVTPQIKSSFANIEKSTLSMYMQIETADGRGKLYGVLFENMPLIGKSWDDLANPTTKVLDRMIEEKLKEFLVEDKN